MLKDQRDLLLEFNARNVKYLVVGSYYSHYTEPRATKDLDIFIAANPENAISRIWGLNAIRRALGRHDAIRLQDGKSWFQIGVALSRIDIIQSIDGVDFDAAWDASEPGLAPDGIPVRYISIDDLIRNKLAVRSTQRSSRCRRPQGSRQKSE